MGNGEQPCHCHCPTSLTNFAARQCSSMNKHSARATYVAWALTDVLAANKVSEVGEMTMGVAAHHS